MQFGVAGLMGGLWLWERAYARKREAQLDATHRRLIHQRSQMRLLIHTINQNTRVIERFEQTQRLVIQLLERMPHEQKPPPEVPPEHPPEHSHENCPQRHPERRPVDRAVDRRAG